MIPITLPALGNHLWQSTAVAALAYLLAWTLKKHGAHVRYWVWFAASVKFLVPFSILIHLGTAVSRESVLPASSPRSIAIVATEIAQPFVVSAAAISGQLPPSRMALNYMLPALVTAWLFGVFTVVMLWARSWFRMRSIVRKASPMTIPPGVEVMASTHVLEPGVFGIFRPLLLVPRDIRCRLSEEELHPVLVHEMCHIRRRDNLLSSIHMSVAAIFWFYPFVWWLGARLLEERERACDEEVLRLGTDPLVCAESILEVCKSYLRSPLTCMSGIAGPNLQKRIEAIVNNKTARKLNSGRKMFLMATALVVLAAPISVGVAMGRTVPSQARAPESQPPAPVPAGFEVASKSAATASAPTPQGQQREATTTTQKEELPSLAPASRDRMLILFFDLNALRTDEVQRAKDTANALIDNQKRAGDLVSVMIHSTDFSVVQDFTSDSQKLHEAVGRINPQDGHPNDTGLSAREVEDRLATLMALARRLRPIPDKKKMIYFNGPVQQPGTVDQSLLRDTVAAAVEANLSFYTVAVRGIDQR